MVALGLAVCEPNRALEVACTYWLSARERLRALRKGPIGKEAFLEVTPISSRARVAWRDPPGGREPRTKWPQDRSAATSDVRGLLGRSRRPPIRGHTSAVPRHGLRGVGCLKQLPKPVFQQFDGLPQSAELRNPDYRDGPAQVKRWGTQYFHGIDRMIPGNKASRQKPDTITGLNER